MRDLIEEGPLLNRCAELVDLTDLLEYVKNLQLHLPDIH